MNTKSFSEQVNEVLNSECGNTAKRMNQKMCSNCKFSKGVFHENKTYGYYRCKCTKYNCFVWSDNICINYKTCKREKQCV